MICPHCSYRDDSIPTPKYTKTGYYSVLGFCKACGERVDIVPCQQDYEESQQAHIERGELREIEHMNHYVSRYEGNRHEKHKGNFYEIDREIYQDNKLLYYMELKLRDNSLNSFAETICNYSKIVYGKELIRKTHRPVYILFKFCDCWARYRIKLDKKYKKGKKAIIPSIRENYSWYQNEEGRVKQITTYIPIEELEILIGLGDILTNYDFPEDKIPKPKPIKEFKLSDFF